MAASLYDHLLTFTGLNRHRQVRRKGKTPTAEHALDTAQPHSLGLLAKVAADEAVCAIRRMLMRSFSREDWHRIAQEVRTAARTILKLPLRPRRRKK